MKSADWIVASSNAGKLAEYRALLEGTPIVLSALDAGAAPPEETGSTFVENALIKARHAAETTGRPAIADDSGLCVDALGGAPGIRSARYAREGASDRDNIERLLQALAGVPSSERRAVFHCVIVALRRADEPAPIIAEGRWAGVIALEPAGRGGFGYDPVFVDPALGRSAAELAAAEKNRVSHRALASAELRRRLGF